MSSRRFPGKVLAPFNGIPIVRHVVDAAKQVLPPECVTVLTSRDPSDDPLAEYLRSIGQLVFRGDLNDVFFRFRQGLERFPCTWMLRLSADSPLLEPAVLSAVLDRIGKDQVDLVTTIYPRTFPKGQNAELVRTETFLSLPTADLSPDDREHVTAYFYRHPDRFRILNIDSGNPSLAETGLAVDTVEDLQRLEGLGIRGWQGTWADCVSMQVPS